MRPLLWVGLGALCGAALAFAGPWAALVLLFIFFPSLILKHKSVLIFISSLAVFCLYTTFFIPSYPPNYRGLCFKSVTLKGRVIAKSPFSGGIDCFVVDGRLPDGCRMKARFFRVRGDRALLCGTVVVVHGLFIPVRCWSAPWREGIFATLSSPDVEVLGFQPGFVDIVANIRDAVCEEVVFNCPRRARVFMRALIFGQRTALNQQKYQTLALVGTSHFLAISGIHLAMLVALSFWVLRRFMLLKARVLVTILLCVVYLVVSGAPVTLLRSLTVVFVLLGGLLIGRRADLLNTVGAALLFLLILDPVQIISPGFQLSFINFTVIAAAYPIFTSIYIKRERLLLSLRGYPPGYEPPFETIRRRAHEILFFSAFASVASLPLLSYYFGAVPLIAVLANFILFPFFYAALATGFASLLLLPFGLSSLVATLFAYINDSVFYIAGALNDIKLVLFIPSLYIPPITLPVVSLFYVALGLTIARLRGTLTFLRRDHIVLIWSLIALLWFLLPQLKKPPPPGVRIISFGSSYTVLMRTPDGMTVLYGLRCRTSRDLHRIVSELVSEGVMRVDALIIPLDEPPDKGFEWDFLRRMRVGAVLYPSAARDDPWTAVVIRRCHRLGVLPVMVDAGDRIGRKLTVLGPPVEIFGRPVGRGRRGMLLFLDIGDGVIVGDPSSETSVAFALLGDTPRAKVAFLTHKPCPLFNHLASKLRLKTAFFPRRPARIPGVRVYSSSVYHSFYPER